MGQEFFKWFGLLSLVLILVVYYKGSTALASAGGQVIQTISYAWTGRDKNGNFANYPGGA